MADNKKSYSLRVDELNFEKLKLISKKNHRSVNAQIEALIAECIASYELKNDSIVVDADK